MKIKQSIINIINNPITRTKIALNMGLGEQALGVQIRKNAHKGRLTKMDALKAISKETGIEVNELLEWEPIEEPTK